MMEFDEQITWLLKDGNEMKIRASIRVCSFEIDGLSKPGSTPVLGMFSLDWDQVRRLQKTLEHLLKAHSEIIRIDQES